MKNNVLLITRDFTPYCKQTGWMIRTVSLANFLKTNEFEVHVLATKRSSQVNKLYLEDGIYTNWVINGLHHALSTSLKLFHPSVIPYLFKYLSTKVKDKYIYDYDQPLISDYRAKISEIIETKGISKIIISTPPHSLLLLIPWVKSKYPSVTVVMDMRDGWSIRPLYKAQGEKQRLMEWHEAEIIKHADACVYVSSGLREIYISKYGNHQSYVIENGFEESHENESADDAYVSLIKDLKSHNKLIIGFFGSATIGYPGKHKDLTPVIEAIYSDELLRERIHLLVQGTINVKKDTNVGSSVTVLDSANHSVIHKHMSLNDIGLVIHDVPREYAPAVIGGKTYDYVKAGIPTLGISDPNSKSLFQMIIAVGGVHADIRNIDEIQRQLHYLLNEYDKHQSLKHLVKVGDINEYSRSHMYKKYLTVLDEIA